MTNVITTFALAIGGIILAWFCLFAWAHWYDRRAMRKINHDARTD